MPPPKNNTTMYVLAGAAALLVSVSLGLGIWWLTTQLPQAPDTVTDTVTQPDAVQETTTTTTDTQPTPDTGGGGGSGNNPFAPNPFAPSGDSSGNSNSSRKKYYGPCESETCDTKGQCPQGFIETSTVCPKVAASRPDRACWHPVSNRYYRRVCKTKAVCKGNQQGVVSDFSALKLTGSKKACPVGYKPDGGFCTHPQIGDSPRTVPITGDTYRKYNTRSSMKAHFDMLHPSKPKC